MSSVREPREDIYILVPNQRIDTQQFSQWPFVQEGETGENSHSNVKRAHCHPGAQGEYSKKVRMKRSSFPADGDLTSL